jgi:hypothetical protein
VRLPKLSVRVAEALPTQVELQAAPYEHPCWEKMNLSNRTTREPRLQPF